MNNLAQYLAYTQPRSGQSQISPLAMSLINQRVTSPWQALGNIALMAADKYRSNKDTEAKASSIAELLAGGKSLATPQLASAGAGGMLPGGGATAGATGGPNPEYERLYQLLMDSPELAPIFQAQALEKQYPDLFSDPENLQKVWDPAQGTYVWGTPQKGVAAEGPGDWQNVGGGQLMRVGPSGQPEFMKIPGYSSGAAPSKDWNLQVINGTPVWVNERTQETKPLEGAPPAATPALSSKWAEETIMGAMNGKETDPATLEMAAREWMDPKLDTNGRVRYNPLPQQFVASYPDLAKQLEANPLGTESVGPSAKVEASLNNLDNAITRYGELLEGIDYGDRFGAVAGFPNAKTAQIKTAITDLQLQLKTMYELGAITGPDYQLMLSLVSDPTNAGSLGAGPEALKAQLTELRGILQRSRAAYAPQQPATQPQADPFGIMQ